MGHQYYLKKPLGEVLCEQLSSQNFLWKPLLGEKFMIFRLLLPMYTWRAPLKGVRHVGFLAMWVLRNSTSVYSIIFL